jgi:hypothetical protein
MADGPVNSKSVLGSRDSKSCESRGLVSDGLRRAEGKGPAPEERSAAQAQGSLLPWGHCICSLKELYSNSEGPIQGD